METVAGFSDEGSFDGVVRIEESKLRGHVEQVVRSSVEETLNGLLEAEADRLCNAKRYERTPDRVDTRAGSYERQLHTKAGEVTLKVPRLRTLAFETQIIERDCLPPVEQAARRNAAASRVWKRPWWRCT